MPLRFFALAMLPFAAQAADVSDTHRWTVGIEIGLARASSELSPWPEGGVGKLRYADHDRGIVANRWYGEYVGRLSPTWTVHATGDLTEDATSGFGITEAYAEWRPIPRSPNRQRWKLGFFHAPWSLENTGPAWTTPFTLSSSAVNTWIGEELRPVGAEWTLQRRIGASGVAVHAAAFIGNDPAGSLLAWRGWAAHDRQSRFSDRLPLAPLPALAPDAMFGLQDPYVEPWHEIDDRVGYYVGAEWRHGRRALVALAHYDNRADPTEIDGGQYAWSTRFEQIAAQLEIAGDFGLMAQWMTGSTVMGGLIGAAHAVDTEFEARYLLLTRRLGKHRVTVRYDDFNVVDHDIVPNDDNTDVGRVWTVAYRFDHSERWSLGVEGARIASGRPAWRYFGLESRAAERMLQLRARLRLGAHPSVN